MSLNMPAKMILSGKRSGSCPVFNMNSFSWYSVCTDVSPRHTRAVKCQSTYLQCRFCPWQLSLSRTASAFCSTTFKSTGRIQCTGTYSEKLSLKTCTVAVLQFGSSMNRCFSIHQLSGLRLKFSSSCKITHIPNQDVQNILRIWKDLF